MFEKDPTKGVRLFDVSPNTNYGNEKRGSYTELRVGVRIEQTEVVLKLPTTTGLVVSKKLNRTILDNLAMVLLRLKMRDIISPDTDAVDLLSTTPVINGQLIRLSINIGVCDEWQ